MQQYSQSMPPVVEEGSLDIKQEVQKYLRFWPWFAIGLILSLVGAYFHLRYAPRVYQTNAKIKILDENGGLELPTSAFVFKRSNINLENEVEILTSYRILEQVVKKLDLSSRFYEKGRIQTSEIKSLPFKYEQLVDSDSITKNQTYEVVINKEGFTVINKANEKETKINNHNSHFVTHDLPFELKIENEVEPLLGKEYLIKLGTVKNTALGLKRAVGVEAIGSTSHLLKLSMKGESTLKSEMIINTLIDVFNQDGINDRQLVSKRTLDFIDERFVYLAQELDSIELDKKKYKQSNSLVYLPTDTEISLELKIKTEEEVFRIENQIALSDLLEEALMNTNSENELLPANIGLENGDVNILIQEFNTVALEKEKLIGSAGQNNPAVLLLMSKLSDLKSNINRSLKTYNKQLTLSLKKITTRNQKFRSQVAEIPRKEKLMRAINRQQNIKESLYLLLLQKREEAAINFAITEPSVKVVEYALSGSSPISPKRNIVYFGALLIGLVVPFGILYVIFMLDTKLHSKKDIEKMTSDIPVAGEIPKISDNNNVFKNPNDRSILAESFRILGSNVNYLLPPRKNGSVIYCTSTIKGEGKTFVSLNLSLALSSINKRVLLIGADLRNPQIHSYFNIEKNHEGLSNYLHDIDFDWKSAIVEAFNEHAHHHTLISGSLPPNPAHLLTNGRFEKLLEEARSLYDYIVVDTSPTILVTDTLLISQLADATMYITRSDYTEKDLLNFSIELEKKKKLKNVAYVLNSVGANKSYGYNYGYGYGYGED